MATTFTNGIDLIQTAIQQALLHPLASDPGSPVDGQVWYNTTTHELKIRVNGVTQVVTTVAGTQTLTNKTIDGDNNTLSNLDLGLEVDWAAIGDVADRTAFAAGDKVLIFEAGVGMRKVDYSDLPGAGGGLANVVEDTTPQLGGQLDVNGQAIGDGTNELLTFVEDVSAVNHLQIENEATGSGPILRSDGDDANVDLNLATKGTGVVNVSADLTATGAVTGSNLSGTNTGDEVAAAEGTAGIAEIATQAEVDAGTDDARFVTPLKLDALDVTGMTWWTNDTTLTTGGDDRFPTVTAVKTYVDNEVAGANNGLRWKDAVRVATTAAGTLATSFENGDTVDGVVLATNDRILIKDQGTASENGIYVVQATGAPTRATDADSGAELVSATVMVEEGTANADTVWSCTTDSPITVDVTGLTFANTISTNVPSASETVEGKIELATQAEVDAGSDTTRAVTPATLSSYSGLSGLGKFTDLIGDGASTVLTVTHNLGSTAVFVSLREVSTGLQWQGDVDITSSNALTVTFATAPATDAFEVCVIG